MTDTWTTDTVRDEVAGFIGAAAATSTPPATITAGIIAILEVHGYDSIDRELAFDLAAETTGRDYDEFYRAWLAQ